MCVPALVFAGRRVEVPSYLAVATGQTEDRPMKLTLLAIAVLLIAVTKARRHPFSAKKLASEATPTPPLPRWVRVEHRMLMCGKKAAEVVTVARPGQRGNPETPH